MLAGATLAPTLAVIVSSPNTRFSQCEPALPLPPSFSISAPGTLPHLNCLRTACGDEMKSRHSVSVRSLSHAILENLV